MIPTFVVNLERTPERKVYMNRLLSQFNFLDVSFIKAIDGKCLSEEELTNRFDRKLAYQRYGRNLNVGEIGCTLSHYQCYQKILREKLSYVLILEDDVTIMKELSIAKELIAHINTNVPTILKKPLTNESRTTSGKKSHTMHT